MNESGISHKNLLIFYHSDGAFQLQSIQSASTEFRSRKTQVRISLKRLDGS